MGDEGSCADEQAVQHGALQGFHMSDKQAEDAALGICSLKELEEDTVLSLPEREMHGESAARDGPCAGGVQEDTAIGAVSDKVPLERTEGGSSGSLSDAESSLESLAGMLDDEKFGASDDDCDGFNVFLAAQKVAGGRPSASGGQDNAAIGIDTAERRLGGTEGRAESGDVRKDVPHGLAVHESKRRRTTSSGVRADGDTVQKKKYFHGSGQVTVDYKKASPTSKTTALGAMIAIPDEENPGKFINAMAMDRFHGGKGGQDGTPGEDTVSVVFCDNSVEYYSTALYREYRENWFENALKDGCSVCFDAKYI